MTGNGHEHPARISRRALLAAAPLGAVAACSGPVPVPDRRMVGVGFEDVAAGTTRLRELATRLDGAGINEVGIAAGRVDWTLFPASENTSWSSDLREVGGRDLLAEAIAALTASGGSGRRVVLVVDGLAPRIIAEQPDLAGVGAGGESSKEFPGLVALARGEVGEKLISLVGEVARRYRPAAISLTELLFEDTTYGEDDLEDFRRETGENGWPRTPGGGIDTGNELLQRWRCEAMASLVSRCRGAAAPHGAELWMEVRAPRNDPGGDRRDSGHDYALLEGASDRLVVWDYFGIAPEGSPSTRDLAKALAGRKEGSGVLSVGLWGSGDNPITPDALKTAVQDAAAGGIGSVWVTPASLMTDAHWKSLSEVWGPR